MATTINSGYGSSPKLTADVASRAEVYGGRGLVFDGVTDYLDCGTSTQSLVNSSTKSVSAWVKIASGASGRRRILVIQKAVGSTRFGIGWGNSTNKFFLS